MSIVQPLRRALKNVSHVLLMVGGSALGRTLGTSPPTPPLRTATVGEIANLVDARRSAEAMWETASAGQSIPTGGAVQTHDASSARVDFNEGTIVRLGPLTLLAVSAPDLTSESPLTRLHLEVGKVFVALAEGGSDAFEVETPVGIAIVRGSVMSAAYDPRIGTLGKVHTDE